ncbi:MAG TPA: hypothetical protein VH540_26640 [Ktedonobacterales bacterium]
MRDDFEGSEVAKSWHQVRLGGAELSCQDSVLRLGFERAVAESYSDAEINDYGMHKHSQYPWRPPLRLEVRARASHPAAHTRGTGGRFALLGTAGFGFWNVPFSLSGSVLKRPEAVWFFYASPPSRMELVPGVPGWGWKAQVVHAGRPGALLAGLPTLTSVALAKITGNQRNAARWVQRLSGAQEAMLDTEFTEWHEYRLDWTASEARFWVDDVEVLRAPNPPGGPLGFVAWVDNQYAIATPRGEFRFGRVNAPAQWLEIDSIAITPLS